MLANFNIDSITDINESFYLFDDDYLNHFDMSYYIKGCIELLVVLESATMPSMGNYEQNNINMNLFIFNMFQ